MLFFGRKKEKENCCCRTSPNANAGAHRAAGTAGAARVRVLGTGCARCNALADAAEAALADLGMDTNVEHVTDFAEIAAHGVMTTPALVVDGKVVSAGRVLTRDEVKELLLKA